MLIYLVRAQIVCIIAYPSRRNEVNLHELGHPHPTYKVRDDCKYRLK